MFVRELIILLQAMPENEEVVIQESGGCDTCNPEGFTSIHEITTASHKDKGTYPYHEKKNYVAIESYFS